MEDAPKTTDLFGEDQRQSVTGEKPVKQKSGQQYSEAFEEWWNLYPRKGRMRASKSEAYDSWKSLKMEKDAARYQYNLLWQTRSPEWTKQDGEFVPAAQRYLKRSLHLIEPDEDLKFAYYKESGLVCDDGASESQERERLALGIQIKGPITYFTDRYGYCITFSEMEQALHDEYLDYAGMTVADWYKQFRAASEAARAEQNRRIEAQRRPVPITPSSPSRPPVEDINWDEEFSSQGRDIND